MINSSRSSDQHGARLHSRTKNVTGLIPRDGFRARSAMKRQDEFSDLESCERVMKESFQRFAEAVARIKNKKLFLEAGYKSFADYCHERWGWTASRGYQIVEANKTIQSLPKSIQPLVENERQVRVLQSLPKSERAKVLRASSQSGASVAKVIHASKAIDVEIVSSEPKPRVHECPMCRC